MLSNSVRRCNLVLSKVLNKVLNIVPNKAVLKKLLVGPPSTEELFYYLCSAAFEAFEGQKNERGRMLTNFGSDDFQLNSLHRRRLFVQLICQIVTSFPANNCSSAIALCKLVELCIVNSGCIKTPHILISFCPRLLLLKPVLGPGSSVITGF